MRFNFTRRALMCVVVGFLLSLTAPVISWAQPAARQWSETNLNCIRKYFAKPTVHARNLFHVSVAMYDAWAVYDDEAAPFFLGNTWGNYTCPFNGIPMPEDGDIAAAQTKALSYATYRTLWNRYTIFAPPANLSTIQGYLNTQMANLGYDPTITSTDYSDGDPAKLGNYIAAKLQEFAIQDGSNQQNNYANLVYVPIHGQLEPYLPGNPNSVDPNRWQALVLAECVDQSGNPIECPPGTGAAALSPEWGNVVPFALNDDDVTIMNRDGIDWKVYHMPAVPPMLDTNIQAGFDDNFFKWGYCVNSIWHSFHTTTDGVMKDISPNGIGNIDYSLLPTTFEEYKAFYDEFNGGTEYEQGYDVNPATGLPYDVQMVNRGDYTRVLSEYWADGPNSETPPGHWYTIINHVADDPNFEMRWEGQGDILDEQEWYVRTYFAVGAGLHDAAIACWSAKGYFDYTRPIMSIRFMADHGQSTDPMLPNYHPAGLPLIPGYIEMVEVGDPLAGENDINVGKVKLYTWKGPEPATDDNGVGWKLAEEWWTYQRATFVTPPFPGYYSGHSTYSRTSAEVLTLLTGSEYFPGGMGQFTANPGYLGADNGPSVPITLQWARYYDAADQCSLSRIYGGLHPPQDDIPGRIVGQAVGPEVYNHSMEYFTADPPHVTSITFSDDLITDADAGAIVNVMITFDEIMDPAFTPDLTYLVDDPSGTLTNPVGAWLIDGFTYAVNYTVADVDAAQANVVVKVTNAKDMSGMNNIAGVSGAIAIDTKNPSVAVSSNVNNISLVNDATVTDGQSLSYTFQFDEMMDVNGAPQINFSDVDASSSFTLNTDNSGWSGDGLTYTASFDVADNNVQPGSISVEAVSANDANGNAQIAYVVSDDFVLDTRNPSASVAVNAAMINDDYTGTNFEITFDFDEDMDQSAELVVDFPAGNPAGALLIDGDNSEWIDANTYLASYYTVDNNITLSGVDVSTATGVDINGNTQVATLSSGAFSIDTENPSVSSLSASDDLLSDADAGSTVDVEVNFSEDMNMSIEPSITFAGGDPLAGSLTLASADWTDINTFTVTYNVADDNDELWNLDVIAVSAQDANGNNQTASFTGSDVLSIDTKNPSVVSVSANTYNITSSFVGQGFNIVSVYDEPMAGGSDPVITFPNENPSASITVNGTSSWLSSTAYSTNYTVSSNLSSLADIDIAISNDATDLAGNEGVDSHNDDFFSINIIISVLEMDPSNGFVVYPNPVESGRTFFVEWANNTTGIEVTLVNMLGEVVLKNSQVTASENRINLDSSNLAAGMYLLNVKSEDGNAVYNVSITK